MENTADELIVIGRGELIAAESLAEFAARGTAPTVTVRSPDAGALAAVLTAEGATVAPYDEETLKVDGPSAVRVGELAHQHRFLLWELTTQTASLEAAFMELTAGSVEYLAGEPR